jgi:DNA repair exonuclease SbcCD ATPase subunit
MSPEEDEKVEMSAKEAYELIRLRASEEIKEEIAHWWKRRFAPTAAVIGVLVFLTGFFGGYQLIQYTAERAAEKVADRKFGEFEKRAEQLRETENDALRAVAAAEHAARKATEGASRAETEASRHATRVQEFNRELAALQERAEQLRSRADHIGELVLDLQADSTGEARSLGAQLQGEIEDLNERLDRLEALLAEVAGESGARTEAAEKVREYERAKQAYVRESRERKEKFEEHRKYEVRIYYTEAARDTAAGAEKRLVGEGFRASAISVRTVSSVYQGQAAPGELKRRMPSENLIVHAEEDQPAAAAVQRTLADVGEIRLLTRQKARQELLLATERDLGERTAEPAERPQGRSIAGQLLSVTRGIEREGVDRRRLVEVYLSK